MTDPMGYVEHLSKELPLCSLKYVRLHHPEAVKIAQAYNAARRSVSLSDPSTISKARKAKQMLITAIGEE